MSFRLFQKLFLILALVSVSCGDSFAQTSRKNPIWSVGEQDDVANKDVSHPLEMFKGWTLLYKGYSKSPIIFDAIYDGKTRKYPVIGDGKKSGLIEEKDTLQTLNIGVDDEITKANMSIYQPIYELEKDFAESKFARDRNLNLASTLRGIAVLTLSYLDKTVAAGLATTQQQVDNNTSNQLLKQIAWATSKMANPGREQLYTDTDEKIEACMISEGRPSKHSSENVRRIIMQEPCIECLDVTKTIPSRSQGLFDYCVCCAERSASINKVNDKSTELWSLVQRIFYGFRLPEVGKGKQDVVERVVKEVNWMYGDLQYKPCEDGNRCQQKFTYVFPDFSVADKIKTFRDGGCVDGLACPYTMVETSSGICPAIKSLMCLWPHTEANDKTMRAFWLQSSLGKLLTAADVENMHIMLERLSGSLKDEPKCQAARTLAQSGATTIPQGYKMDWKPAGEFGRWLDGFCDAAAFSAFKKYHFRMSAIVEDHIAMNLKASDNEKRKMRDLMGRVSTDINLAEADRGASEVADRMVEGLNMAATRQKVTQVAAGAEALDGQRENREMSGSIKNWNLFTGQ